MSYAAEVARGIQAEAEKEFDSMIVNSGTDLIRMSQFMQRAMRYQDAAEVFEFAENLWLHAGRVDHDCDLVRLANKLKAKVRGGKVLQSGDTYTPPSITKWEW